MYIDLCNIINVSKYNRCSIVQIPFSKEYLYILLILLKEGFIRGYFVETSKNVKTIHILLKHIGQDNPFQFKKISLVKHQVYCSNFFLKKRSGGFKFSIVSTEKGIMSSNKAVKLGLGGFPMIDIV